MVAADEVSKGAPRAISEVGKERKELKYKGVRRRSWGKWISEIRVSKKKSRLWLGSHDSPHKAARAYDAAALCLKGESAVLNFPHAAHTLPRPAQSLPQHIQSAASEAAQSFDEHRTLLLSDPHSLEPPEEEIGIEKWCELSKGDAQENSVTKLSMGEVDSWADVMLEPPDMLERMAEALLLTPPPMHDYDDDSKPEDIIYLLWND